MQLGLLPVGGPYAVLLRLLLLPLLLWLASSPLLPPPCHAPADRMVLKTCGTTKLLSCVPYMCQLAEGLGMAPARVK